MTKPKKRVVVLGEGYLIVSNVTLVLMEIKKSGKEKVASYVSMNEKANNKKVRLYAEIIEEGKK